MLEAFDVLILCGLTSTWTAWTMADWAREYFERGYAQRWGLRAPSDQVRLEAGGLWNLLQLSPTTRIIDIGCGHGRHALAFAERGPEVVGLDSADAL